MELERLRRKCPLSSPKRQRETARETSPGRGIESITWDFPGITVYHQGGRLNRENTEENRLLILTRGHFDTLNERSRETVRPVSN